MIQLKNAGLKLRVMRTCCPLLALLLYTRKKSWRTFWKIFVRISNLSFRIHIVICWLGFVRNSWSVRSWLVKNWEQAMPLQVTMNPIISWIQSELRIRSLKTVNELFQILWVSWRNFLQLFFIYFLLVYHFLDVLRGRQNVRLLDRVQSWELYLISLGMIWELIII